MMREVLTMAKGTPRDAGGLRGLLSLDCHPDLLTIFRSGNIEDDYDVEKDPIARGKFGAVRRARHRATGQVYAAKYVRRRRRNVSLEGETRHEVAVLLLGLRDPHIVSLHQVYETRTEYIILLEFAGGGDLQRVLDEAVSLPEEEVRVLLRQVLRGLSFLHAHSIAHLDIKPQNLVMMGESPEAGVKLVDFGLSRVITKGDELTQIMGTPDYVAPEVISYEPISLATDMWSVGVLTYVFLTSCTPFGGETDAETYVNITRANVDFPEELFAHISDQARDFICGLLVKKPSDRMTVDECLSHVWMTSPASSLHPPLITDSLDDVQEEEEEEEEEETSGYHSVYSSSSSYSPPDDPYSDQIDSTYSTPDDPYSSSSYLSPATVDPYSTPATYPPPTTDHLYPLPETEQGDSAYSSDSSSSPTFTEGYGSGLVVPPLCHCTIPEEQQQQQHHHQQVRPQTLVAGALTLSRRQRNRGVSVDMEETLRSLHNRRQPRATRRASLVFDDPRYFQDHLHDVLRPNLIEGQQEVALTRDSDVDSGVSCHDCDDPRPENPRLCHLDSYEGIDVASVVSWDDYADLGGRRLSLTQYDQATLCSVAKPWEKLCNGSVSRAMTQLTVVKKVSKNPELQELMVDPRVANCDITGSMNDLHASKSDLRASKAELRASKTDLRASKSDLRASKSDLRASKSDLRASKAELRASRQDLRASKPDLRASSSDLCASKSDLRASKSELRASKSDLRASKSDLRASKSDLRASKSDLRGSRTDLRGSRTNLTLSRLDLAHETLSNSCVAEDESEVLRCDLTLPRRSNFDRSTLASFMRGNSLHMSFRQSKRRDMQI